MNKKTFNIFLAVWLFILDYIILNHQTSISQGSDTITGMITREITTQKIVSGYIITRAILPLIIFNILIAVSATLAYNYQRKSKKR